MLPLPPTPPLFPYTTLFRSIQIQRLGQIYGFAPESRTEGGVNIQRIITEFGELGVVMNRHVASALGAGLGDRKSTRLNSSHVRISYAVFCLKKKKRNHIRVA